MPPYVWTPWRHWYRRWGWRGCKRTLKKFDLVKIRAKSFKIRAKSLKIFTKSLKIWANSLKIWSKMAPNMVWFNKMAPKMTWRAFFWKSLFLESFRTSLGEFGQKSFAPPKIRLLLHLCMTALLYHFSNMYEWRRKFPRKFSFATEKLDDEELRSVLCYSLFFLLKDGRTTFALHKNSAIYTTKILELTLITL